MKKIMFNDKYGLTQAVLEGRKTMTRRIIPLTDTDKEYLDTAFDWDLREGVIIDRYAKYKVGEEVAVAQCYEDAILDVGEEEWNKQHKWYNIKYCCHEAGLHNKMFVKADLMPHRIRITNIKVERLQDISEEDALKEGIYYNPNPPKWREYDHYEVWHPSIKPFKYTVVKDYCTAKFAFADLINRVSGKGTWESNPWVFVYEFELIRKNE